MGRVAMEDTPRLPKLISPVTRVFLRPLEGRNGRPDITATRGRHLKGMTEHGKNGLTPPFSAFVIDTRAVPAEKGSAMATP